MSIFKKGQFVVKILSCAGVETATIEQIEKVSKKVAILAHCSLKYDAQTGREIDPVIGSTRLITLDSGQEEKIAESFNPVK